MMMRTPAAIMALIGLFAVLSGCLQQFGAGTSYGDAYLAGLNPVAIYNDSYFEECKLGTCWCMVCQNGTNLFGIMKNFIGGSCFMDKNCNATRFKDIADKTKNPSLSTRMFLLGQGPTFSDFAAANTYCGNQLGMAVQWLPAIGQAPYTEPDPARAMCLLSKEVMPVYMLYSGGNNIDVTQARKIGTILGTGGTNFFQGRLCLGPPPCPVGPVIVVVEPDADKSHAAAIAQAVLAIDQECNPGRDSGNISCFMAVGPRFNDYAAVEELMKQPGMDRSVDFIAYGINGSSAHTCEPFPIQEQALNFSKYALYNWSKPTLISYVLFDVGAYDAEESCQWTESRVASAYSAFLPSAIQKLRASGVIGIAPYSFNLSGTTPIVNPLNCSNCGVARSEGGMKGWYGGCQAYTTTKDASGNVKKAIGQSILFANASGGSCQHEYSDVASFALAYRNHDFMQPQLAAGPDKMEKWFACDACLMANTTKKVTDMFRFDLRFGYEEAPSITTEECEKYASEIDAWSGARNLDPSVVRAIIKIEGNFDECAAARSCKWGYSDAIQPACFPTGEGYGNGYDEMYDPKTENTCEFQNAPPPAGSQTPDYRWIGLGMMQTLVPPSTFWPGEYTSNGEDGLYYDIFDKAGFDTPEFRAQNIKEAQTQCSPEFNPFVAGDSICLGTLTFQTKLENAKDQVRIYHQQGRLNWPSSNQDKDSVFATYVALNKYGGFWDANLRGSGATLYLNPGCSSGESDGECWTRTFKESWTHNDTWCADTDNQDDSDYDLACLDGEARRDPPPAPGSMGAPAPAAGAYYCYGYTDFVEFVHDCHVPFLARKTDPGARKMAMYDKITTTCTTFCPEGETLMEKLGMATPASGTPYLPDSLPDNQPP